MSDFLLQIYQVLVSDQRRVPSEDSDHVVAAHQGGVLALGVIDEPAPDAGADLATTVPPETRQDNRHRGSRDPREVDQRHDQQDGPGNRQECAHHVTMVDMADKERIVRNLKADLLYAQRQLEEAYDNVNFELVDSWTERRESLLDKLSETLKT
jgi:hypothetical protein